MPKQTKSKGSTSKTKKLAVPRTPTLYRCDRCGSVHKKQQSIFFSSKSSFYTGNGGYLSTCKKCVEEVYLDYKRLLNDDRLALRRVCMRFDIYWSEEIYQMTYQNHSRASVIGAYLKITNLVKYASKTFDSTLAEEFEQGANGELQTVIASQTDGANTGTGAFVVLNVNGELANTNNINDTQEVECVDIGADKILTYTNKKFFKNGKIHIPTSVIKYWGRGFKAEDYIEYEEEKEKLLQEYPDDYETTPGEDALIKQICLLSVAITHDFANGDSPRDKQETLNKLMNSLNIQPNQKKETKENYIPFGVEIKNWEDSDPVILRDERYKDVDGVNNMLAITIGGICHTANVHNEYTEEVDKAFKEWMDVYKVERPVVDDSLLYDEEDGE